jgi:DNA-binding transcriptional regulator YiaG
MKNYYTPENLRTMIKILGLTRAEFAKRFGVTKRALDNWCLPFESNGHRDIPAQKWVEIVEEKLDIIS